MKKSRILRIISVLTIISICITILKLPKSYAAEDADITVNLTNLAYTVDGSETKLKTYTQSDFETFLSDYNSGNLPAVYVTEFLFDGISMVKTYDLDDFTESGNDVEVETLEITVINVNTTGNIQFTGEITGGMIAVDTNGRNGDINLILNNASIDTDSKKAPAIYVYNKDITYTGCKVTIRTTSGSKNYIEGGKLKKVSLIGSDELDSYTSRYSGESKTNYTTYTNYYGVYTSEQVSNILFAKVQAANEDLSDGDPYYFYKASGAISSDIDLYFEGTGYLEVTSKNKEGIETKGNLTFAGGTGDYAIYSEDDCLNTTTDRTENNSARNSLTIDVNSLIAIVDNGEDSDEGDAIDSNGTLTINGGTIIAIAHPGQDAGLDSENGTYINGGTVIATGDMYDAISEQSKQNFMVLSFNGAQQEGSLITLLDEEDNVIMAYKTDRSYTNLVYSSEELTDGTYYLYKDGNIEGESNSGLYTKVTNYEKGTVQGYSSTGGQGGMQGRGMRGQMQGENMANEPMEAPTSDNMQDDASTVGNRPDRRNQNGITNQDMATDNNIGIPENGDFTPPSEENFNMQRPDDGDMMQPGNMQNTNASATNKEFIISGISNQFSGVANYGESAADVDGEGQSENTENTENSSNAIKSIKDSISNPIIVGGIAAGVLVVLIVIALLIRHNKKKKE